jgi:DDE domain
MLVLSGVTTWEAAERPPFLLRGSWTRCAGSCAWRGRTARSRSSWPSAASRSTTSPSTGGSSASPRRRWPRPPGPADTAVGDRWQVDATSVQVAGRWRYVDRAIDQVSQVIDVSVSARRDAEAARRVFRTGHRHDQGHALWRAPPTGLRPLRRCSISAGCDLASDRPGRQQPHRMRPEAAHGAATTDARAQPGPRCHGRAGWACLVQNPRRRRSELLATALAYHPSTRCNRAEFRQQQVPQQWEHKRHPTNPCVPKPQLTTHIRVCAPHTNHDDTTAAAH